MKRVSSNVFFFCGATRFVQGGGKRKTEKLGRLFGEEGDVMEEHERDQVEQNALQVGNDRTGKLTLGSAL